MNKFLLTAILACCVSGASATHLRCGYITASRTSCMSQQYTIRITVFTNTESPVMFGSDGVLNFGDGTSMAVPETMSTPRPDLGEDIGIADFVVQHVYNGQGPFLISYIEPNRNGGVLNMDNSFFTTFYTETRIDLSTCTPTPDLLTVPIFTGFKGNQFSVSLGVNSPADQLVTYSFVVPNRDRGLGVVNYQHPENLKINRYTGLITWDMLFNGEFTEGEYNFAAEIRQMTDAGGDYITNSYIRIDFQVILTDQERDAVFTLHDDQLLDEYSRVLVKENEEKKIKVIYNVPADREPGLQMFSQLTEEALSFETYDSTSTETGEELLVGLITVHPTEAITREHAYNILVRASTHIPPQEKTDISYLLYTDEIPVLPVITSVEREITEVNVFPNPTTDRVKIRTKSDAPSEIIVYNAQGISVIHRSFQTETELTLGTLPAGMYICDVRSNAFIVKKIKLIKK